MSTTASRESKRPFQPSITSFFGRADRDDTQTSRFSTPERSASPVLPSNIQSSLLNVGMRVRKSVPEGYRNKAVETVSTPSTYPRARSLRPPSPSAETRSGGGSYASELTPFCGILRIGGHAAQTSSSTSSTQGGLFDDPPGLDFPGSSQESNESVETIDSAPTTDPAIAKGRNKRIFEGDANLDDCLIFDEDEFLSSSPSSYPISHTSMPTFDTLRSLARPKTRRKHHVSVLRPDELNMIHQSDENSPPENAGDFGEADFLRPPEYRDHEVEMGGL